MTAPPARNQGWVLLVLTARTEFDVPWEHPKNWTPIALGRLRKRQARELVPAGRINVKYSRGCLVDAEYAVQYLQLLHGAERPELRTPSTLEALDELTRSGLLSAAEGAELREAYIYWRRISEALRMVHGAARDLVLPETGSEELGFLARRMRYEARTWPEAAAVLLADVEAHRERTRALFNRRFHEPV